MEATKIDDYILIIRTGFISAASNTTQQTHTDAHCVRCEFKHMRVCSHSIAIALVAVPIACSAVRVKQQYDEHSSNTHTHAHTLEE